MGEERSTKEYVHTTHIIHNIESAKDKKKWILWREWKRRCRLLNAFTQEHTNLIDSNGYEMNETSKVKQKIFWF